MREDLKISTKENMKTTNKWALLSLIGVMSLSACSGNITNSSSATDTIPVSGTLKSSGSTALLKAVAATTTTCPADRVLATDTAGTTSTVDVDADCAFSIDLTADTSYVISFSKDNVFVATLLFTSGSGTDSTVVTLNSSLTELDLGSILIDANAGQATPENNPLELTDTDNDGVKDSEDNDYDDSNVDGISKIDCDEDHIVDSLQTTTPTCISDEMKSDKEEIEQEDEGENSGSVTGSSGSSGKEDPENETEEETSGK